MEKVDDVLMRESAFQYGLWQNNAFFSGKGLD